MRQLGFLLSFLLAQAAAAGDVYRWESKDGETHYTDDPHTIPKGVKATSTSGDELGEINVGARPAPAPTAATPRAGRPSTAIAERLTHAEALAKSGRCPLAFEAITEAATLATTDLDRRGIAAGCGRIALERLESGAPDDAARFVRKGKESDPEEPTLNLASGELALAKGDQARAIEEFELGLSRNPDHHALKKRLDELKSRSTAFGGLAVTTSKWVTVSFDGTEDALVADLVVKTIEEARPALNELYGYTGEQRVEVVLYPGRTFESASPNHPTWAGGFYDGKIHLPTGGAAKLRGSLQTVLLHEYGHRILNRIVGHRSASLERKGDKQFVLDLSKFAGAPAWMDEGLAQVAAWARTGGSIPCSQGHTQPLRTLEASFCHASGRVLPLYLEAQHAVEWMTKKYGAASVKKVLARLGEGASFEDAFEGATNARYADFAAAFDKPGAEH